MADTILIGVFLVLVAQHAFWEWRNMPRNATPEMKDTVRKQLESLTVVNRRLKEDENGDLILVKTYKDPGSGVIIRSSKKVRAI
ncbi:MAG: hypothetical protein JJ891_06970 [Rhizobiaceae bacterium]|nr:hypothetical protein [Rhizobiaceae bacterium]